MSSDAAPEPVSAAATDESTVTNRLENTESTTAPSEETFPTRQTSHKPTDSKGWDGKLRVSKEDMKGGNNAIITNPEALSDPEYSDEENVVKGEELPADEDLLDEFDENEDDINLIHSRITSISALRLERFKKVERLCLRQNSISVIELPDSLHSTLKELDLYDNIIGHIKGLDHLTNLTWLDLSYNKIKHIKRLETLTELQELYLIQNKISTIENLESLTKLRNLELGANRIREIQGLETLVNLENLWLGSNKITQLKGLDTLNNLTTISIQSNRLTSISGISHLANLEELYLSHNAITSLAGLEYNTNLRTLDVSNNPVASVAGLKPLKHLEEFWASYCRISDLDEVERELGDKEELETVYLEGNPVQLRQPATYRNRVKLTLPRVKKIDATFVRV